MDLASQKWGFFFFFFTYSGVEQARGDQRAEEEDDDEGEENVGFSWRHDKLPPDRVREVTRMPRSMYAA